MISILTRPERYSPAGNNVIWQVESDNPNLVYFKVKVLDEDTTSVINTLNIYPTPQAPSGSFVNLSKLLSNVVNWEVNNDSTKLVVPLHKTVRSYRLIITERVVNNLTGEIEDGDEFNNISDVSYIFNAKLGRITASNYIGSKYVINPSSMASFMTNKPNFSKVNDISAEQLYFMQDGTVSGLKVRIRTYNNSGVLITTEVDDVPDTDTYIMYRLNISPKGLKESSNMNFTNVKYYVVDVIDSLSAARTEERVYFYEDTECHLEYVNLLWVNSLGGLDSYQFVAPIDTINVDRFQMKRNTTAINDDGIYTDINSGVYNPSDVIIDNKTTTTTKVTSKELKDSEAYWLQELFSSRQIFVELTDTILAPALLNNTSYTIPRKRYSQGQLNVTSIEFTLAEGIIPTGAQAFSSRTASIEFIDLQMNALVANIPGYGITLEESERQYDDGDYDSHDYA